MDKCGFPAVAMYREKQSDAEFYVLPVTGTVLRQEGISLSTEQDRCHSTCSFLLLKCLIVRTKVILTQ